MQATFVLVSGAWHAGWCWERVKPLLEARGHVVLTPDLLGMGEDHTPLAEVTLARWADQIAELIRDQSNQVILVGHSRGGIVISETAERVPERIRSLVYVAAFLLPDGDSLLAAGARARDPEAPPSNHVLPAPDGTAILRTEAIGPTFYNTTEPQWVARAASLVGPEPMRVLTTPLKLTETRFGRVRRAYVEALQDQAVPITLQRLMQEKLPCDPVIALDTDHSPFYSDPQALTAALEQIAFATLD